MGVAITLNGVDVTDKVAGFTTQRRVNTVGLCTVSLIDPAGALRPASFQPLTVTIDGTATFTGRVARVGFSLAPDDAGRIWAVTARNANARARRVLINTVIPAGTLKAALLAVAANFGAVGVTVDAGMATGPDLPEIGVAWQTGEQFLNTLTTYTGWLWEIDDTDLELRMWAIGSRTAPATFSAAAANIEGTPGDTLITWAEENLDYRNGQWVIFGGSAGPDATKTDRFEGDGSTRIFTPRYWVRTRPSQVYDEQAAAYRNIGIKGVDTLFEWVWDEDNLRLEQLTEAPPGTAHAALTAGQFIQLTYAWLTPQAEYVTDAGEIAAKADGDDTGLYDAVETRDEITDLDAARAWGLARIRQTIGTPQEVAILTRTVGNDPGEVVPVSVGTEADLEATYLIESEQISYAPRPAEWPGEAPYELRVRLGLVGGDEHRENEVDYWKRILGLGGSSGGSAVSIGGSGSGGTGTPSTDRYAFHLGGSALVDVAHSTWVAVPGYLDWVCPSDGAYRCRVEVWTTDAGTSVTPRLYDLTASSAAAVGSASSSTSRAEQVLNLSALAGHRYRLQVLPGNTSAGVLGIGSIETEAVGGSGGGGGGGGGTISDGDKGDITVSSGGTSWTIDAGAVTTSKLGGDITSAGTALLDDADASAQRATLGLGDAATKNVGTSAGTVAAGDHNHDTEYAGLAHDHDGLYMPLGTGVTSVTGTSPIASTGGTTPAISLSDNGVSNAKLRDSAALSVIGRSANSSGDPADIAAAADGDVLRRSGTALGFGAIPESSVTGLVGDLGALATAIGDKQDASIILDELVAAGSPLSSQVLGALSADTPVWLTVAQLTALVATFTSSLKGAVPASGGGTSNYLRADGTWAAPPGGGGGGLTLPQAMAIGSLRS